MWEMYVGVQLAWKLILSACTALPWRCSNVVVEHNVGNIAASRTCPACCIKQDLAEGSQCFTSRRLHILSFTQSFIHPSLIPLKTPHLTNPSTATASPSRIKTATSTSNGLSAFPPSANNRHTALSVSLTVYAGLQADEVRRSRQISPVLGWMLGCTGMLRGLEKWTFGGASG